MEGLVDYVRRQVKCPECRAEHRIPYNGVQGFPSNVTLQRFLEAHIEITGEAPDPFTGQIMERCGVCNEKNYLSTCSHCDKKICVDCKAAHTEILKREIGRINNQVKRAVHRLSDQLSIVERNLTALKHNSDSVTEEMDNISKRLQKAIRDRSDFLRNEVATYYNTELRNLTLLKEGLEQEISNVESNMDLADKHMDDQTSWDDAELMDTKDIFLRTMEFIRSFDYEAGDYNRRAKFNPPDDLNKLAASLSTLGELIISNPKQTIDGYGSGSSSIPSGLMKSKSDHRLAAQFRDQEESFGSGRTSPVSRRRFGDRLHVHEDAANETSSPASRHRFRSRFMRREEEEEKPMRFDDEQVKARVRVIDTEDVSRGPLSGILRMVDSPRVIQRLQDKERNIKKKKDEPPKPPTPVAQAPKPSVTFGTPRKTARQTSNDDEIDKIKKQNKNEAASASATATPPPAKPALERLTSLKDNERSSRSDRTSSSPRSSTHSPSNAEEETTTTSRYRDYNNSSNSPSTTVRKTSTETPPTTQKTYPFSPSSSTSSVGDSGKSKATTKALETASNSLERRLSRSNSTESNKSGDGAASPRTGAAFSTDELKNRFQKTGDSKSSSSTTPSTRTSNGGSGGSSRFQSRFLARPGTPSVEASKESGNEEDEEESSEESDSEESEESSEEEDEKENAPLYSRSDGGTHAGRSTREAARKDTNHSPSSTASSANDSGYGSSNNSRYHAPTSPVSTSTPNSISTPSTNEVQSHRRPSYLESSRLAAKEKEREDDFEAKYPYASKFLNRNKTNEEETKTPFQSRFLNKSKSSALLGPDSSHNDEEPHSPTATSSSSRAKFEELKEKRQRLARSKSSAGMDEEEAAPEPTSTYRSRYGRDTETPTPSTPSSRLTSTPEDANAPANQLSNWAKYLKNKYGNKTGTGAAAGSGASSILGASGSSSPGASSSSLSSRTPSTPSSRAIARSRSSHLLGFGKDDSSEDESKNGGATPTSQAVGTLGPTPFGNLHRSQYLHKQQLIFKIGSRGSEPGSFTWPRGIAIGPDDSIVVGDSSNHRVQVFDKEGNFVKYFGSYGNGEGEFDCLSGVAVNKTGQYIIADRYNHRVQIFDPSGNFLRSFGSQGSGDGKFSYPWGVTTDALGFIYVCDKENHRIQVFQSDGTFVGKFGTIGNKAGQLEHPHYIAVSSANKVIVSDSNNHRIQIFDTNGKLISTFGCEGSDEGQFKFPRGVAVDEHGFIFVADSGNNRIQIFHPDGTFLRCFGCWGSNDGEFKGLEGVSVMSNGNILICDRENHRVQVF